MQERVFRRSFERGTPGLLYTEDQLEKRFKFMCSLAKCPDGPTLNTFKKLQMMAEMYNEVSVIKMTLKAETEPESFERTWTTEEEGQVMEVAQRDIEALKTLPEEVQAQLGAFMTAMRENNRFKQEYSKGELLRFIEADKDMDGRLNMDEYFDFWDLSYRHFFDQYGAYTQKSDEEVRSDYEMLCSIGRSDDGVNYQSIVKCNNILIVGTAHMDIEKEVVHLEDDDAPLYQWTQEQMDTLMQIDKEDDELIYTKLPPALSDFMQRLYKRALTETFDREMQALLDKQLFIQLDKDKKGRLTYEEFKGLFDIRRDMFAKELGGTVYDYTDEQIAFRYQFACSLAESTAGPTLRTFDKWMIMHRFLYDSKHQND